MNRFEPISFDVPEPEGSLVYCQREGQEVFGWHLHEGARIAWQAPDWADDRILLSILGGTAPDPGYADDGAAILISREGLRQLAADLLAVADSE